MTSLNLEKEEKVSDLSERVEAVLQNIAEADKQIEELYAKKVDLKRKLKGVQNQVELICQDCGHTMILADAELIREYYNEWYSQTDEETYSSKRLLWVCPSCSYISYIRDDNDLKWGNPVELSKVTYEWHSSNRQPSGRAQAILKPALERRAKERAQREKEEMLERARQVLRNHGEL